MAIKCGKCNSSHATIVEVQQCHGGTEPLATLKQVEYIRILRDQRQHNEEATTEAKLQTMTKKAATAIIEELKAAPRKVRSYEEPTIKRWPSEPDVTGTVPLGTYTVVLDSSTRRTIRFQKGRMGKFKGIVVVKYLAGSDNESDYVACGNEVEGGIRFWNRFTSKDNKVVEAVKFLMQEPEKRMEAGERYAVQSSNCYRCGRKLTVPTSIHRGLGPECATKV